jgi:hypothetical protein
MKKSHLIGILCAAASSSITAPSHAALSGRLPLTPGGTDYQAYYDDQLDITWTEHASINGYASWQDQIDWAAGLTVGGVSGWRLANMDVNGDGTIVDCSTASATDCLDNEYGYQYWQNGATASSPSPFKSIQTYYWSSTVSSINSDFAERLYFVDGSMSINSKVSGAYAWAVHDGDVATKISYCYSGTVTDPHDTALSLGEYITGTFIVNDQSSGSNGNASFYRLVTANVMSATLGLLEWDNVAGSASVSNDLQGLDQFNFNAGLAGTGGGAVFVQTQDNEGTVFNDEAAPQPPLPLSGFEVRRLQLAFNAPGPWGNCTIDSDCTVTATLDRVNACLESQDDQAFGPGAITHDPATGKQWLDLRLSSGHRVEDVQSQLGPGGAFAGFRYATREEIETLFSNALILDVGGSPVPSNYYSVTALIDDYLGPTGINEEIQYKFTQGFVADQNSLQNYFAPSLAARADLRTASATTNATTTQGSSGGIGHWLVRDDGDWISSEVDGFAPSTVLNFDNEVPGLFGDYQYGNQFGDFFIWPTGGAIQLQLSESLTDSFGLVLRPYPGFDIGDLALRSSVPFNLYSVEMESPTFDHLTIRGYPSDGPLVDQSISYGSPPLPQTFTVADGFRNIVMVEFLGDPGRTNSLAAIDNIVVRGGTFYDYSDVFSNDFTDMHRGGRTSGNVTFRSDLIVAVSDATDPAKGVHIAVTGGGSGTARVVACNFSVRVFMNLTDGDVENLTCGSITIEVLQGEISLDIGDGDIVLNAPAGAIATVSEQPGAGIQIENAPESTEAITLTVEGQQIPVTPGEPNVNVEIGIIASNVNPTVSAVGTDVSISANIKHFATGDSSIAGAQYSVDGADFVGMLAKDGVFDEVDEDVEAIIPAYQEAGIHEVCVRGLTSTEVGQTECILLAVYDPDGGFVTGGGWIDSPAGAYAADPTLTGKADFGFVAKYKKGQNVPDGNTEFQFKAGALNFKSSAYEWLVVAGPKGIFKGLGTINGTGNYGFQLSAIDADLTPSTEVDLFRVKIWDKDNGDAVVYDNNIGSADDADPTTVVGGGSIIIHTDNGNN